MYLIFVYSEGSVVGKSQTLEIKLKPKWTYSWGRGCPTHSLGINVVAGRQAAIGPELPSYMGAAHTSALEAILSSTHSLPIFSMEESQRADHVHPCGNATRGPFAGGA